MATESESGTGLVRTLGLVPIFMIGAGTMLGAGIFVFPGLAGGRTGGGSAVSFAIGGAVALVVALAASELATEVPKSGGIINFADRAFGRSAAAILGLAQWAGLVFSIGFYLLGFGHYTIELLRSVGWDLSRSSAWAFGLGGCGVLTTLALFDTKTSGRVQKYLVATLLCGLVGFIGIGLYAPLAGLPPTRSLELTPHGGTAILTTAALVFTSYIGFVQITNVAGDAIKPRRNLTLAMIGSVVAVTIIYVLVALMTSLTFSPAELGEMGETAIANVAAARIGPTGRLLVLTAGLLATLSSANAAILATSRTLFALGRDRLAPSSIAKLSRFGTPQRALIASAIPATGLLLAGQLEMLAEAASLLHLAIYSALCFALLRTRSEQGRPQGFQTPLYPVLPIVGGIACVVLAAFFSTGPQLIAAAVLATAAVLWIGFRQWAR